MTEQPPLILRFSIRSDIGDYEVSNHKPKRWSQEFTGHISRSSSRAWRCIIFKYVQIREKTVLSKSLFVLNSDGMVSKLFRFSVVFFVLWWFFTLFCFFLAIIHKNAVNHLNFIFMFCV